MEKRSALIPGSDRQFDVKGTYVLYNRHIHYSYKKTVAVITSRKAQSLRVIPSALRHSAPMAFYPRSFLVARQDPAKSTRDPPVISLLKNIFKRARAAPLF